MIYKRIKYLYLFIIYFVQETTNSNSQLKSSFNETSKTPTMNNTNRITDSNGTLSSNKSGSNVTNGTTMKTDPYRNYLLILF